MKRIKKLFCKPKMIDVVPDICGLAIHPFTGETFKIVRFTLVNHETGMIVRVITFGATVTSIQVKDYLGSYKEVTLGFDSIQEYKSMENPYFGAIIGRVCNRIDRGRVTLEGKEYQLSQNEGKHHIHGGYCGFSRVPWNIMDIHRDGVSLFHTSPHMAEGYPGEITVTVRYTLHSDNSLRVYMTALCKAPTIVNLTNHMYFNLAGDRAGSQALREHVITIYANRITVTDKEGIPTGELHGVGSGCYDFRTGKNLGMAMDQLPEGKLGFDDNFVVHRYELTDKDAIVSAKAWHLETGLWMEITTNQPGIQFYTANYLPDCTKGQRPLIGRLGAPYTKHQAFCMETQKFPDAPNHPNFPPINLKPGELYEHRVTYKFGTQKPMYKQEGDNHGLDWEDML